MSNRVPNRMPSRRIARIVGAALLSASVLTVTACGDDSGGTGTPSQAEWGALGADEKATYEFIVPYGTSVRIDQGQVVDLMPRLLEVNVGDSIRITNQDGRDYMIGPFYVTAGQSLAMRFTHEGELSGVCSMNPEGEFVIKVSQ